MFPLRRSAQRHTGGRVTFPSGPSHAHHGRDFGLFWAADALSLAGIQFANLALPLTAILYLHADGVSVGLLVGIGGLPWLMFGLFTGMLVDRLPRRPVLIAVHLSRALVVDASRLATANSRLAATAGTTRATGPSLAGIAVQYLGATLTMAFTSLTYLMSAVLVGRIQTRVGHRVRSTRRSLGFIPGGSRVRMEAPSAPCLHTVRVRLRARIFYPASGFTRILRT